MDVGLTRGGQWVDLSRFSCFPRSSTVPREDEAGPQDGKMQGAIWAQAWPVVLETSSRS